MMPRIEPERGPKSLLKGIDSFTIEHGKAKPKGT